MLSKRVEKQEEFLEALSWSKIINDEICIEMEIQISTCEPDGSSQNLMIEYTINAHFYVIMYIYPIIC